MNDPEADFALLLLATTTSCSKQTEPCHACVATCEPNHCSCESHMQTRSQPPLQSKAKKKLLRQLKHQSYWCAVERMQDLCVHGGTPVNDLVHFECGTLQHSQHQERSRVLLGNVQKILWAKKSMRPPIQEKRRSNKSTKKRALKKETLRGMKNNTHTTPCMISMCVYMSKCIIWIGWGNPIKLFDRQAGRQADTDRQAERWSCSAPKWEN